ncbi:MAG: glycosyltransferase [Candidatus Sulfotelmatobacter sp.]
MKTLHLTSYWHERSGGIATFYRHLLEAASRHRQSMVLIVPGAKDEVQELGTHCRIYKIAAPASPLNHEYRIIYPREFFLPGSKIQKILAAERPDLVEICDKYSLVHLGPLLRMGLARSVDFRPIVVGLTCERMDENFGVYVSRSWWARVFTRFYVRNIYFPAFDHHIAISDNTAAELKEVNANPIVPRGIWLRSMGVDIEHLSRAKHSPEMRSQLLDRCSAPQNSTLLLYVGRLAAEKNLDLLIATMAELKKSAQDFRLLLVGHGSARERLQRAAQTLVPGHVAVLGHIGDREQLARVYANSDVFVHPNPTEPFGIAPLEAMASGLPLVAPDRGGVTSYANDTNAYLIPPTPHDFARAIVSACQDQPARALKVRAARQTAESFAWPKVTDSFLGLYEELYRLGAGQISLKDAQPAFVSPAATVGHAGRLRFAANLAQAAFWAYVRAHDLVRATKFHDRTEYDTELKGIQSQ